MFKESWMKVDILDRLRELDVHHNACIFADEKRQYLFPEFPLYVSRSSISATRRFVSHVTWRIAQGSVAVLITMLSIKCVIITSTCYHVDSWAFTTSSFVLSPWSKMRYNSDDRRWKQSDPYSFYVNVIIAYKCMIGHDTLACIRIVYRWDVSCVLAEQLTRKYPTDVSLFQVWTTQEFDAYACLF